MRADFLDTEQDLDYAPLSGANRLQQAILKARDRGLDLGLIVTRTVQLSSLTWRTSLRKDFYFCTVKILISSRIKKRLWSIKQRLQCMELALEDLESHFFSMVTPPAFEPNLEFRPYQVSILTPECGRLVNAISRADRLSIQISHAVAQQAIERTHKINGLEYAVFLNYLRLKLLLDLEEHFTFESAVDWCQQFPNQPQAIKYRVALPRPS